MTETASLAMPDTLLQASYSAWVERSNSSC